MKERLANLDEVWRRALAGATELDKAIRFAKEAPTAGNLDSVALGASSLAAVFELLGERAADLAADALEATERSADE